MFLFLEHFDACEKRNRKDRKRKSQTDLGSFVTKTPRIRPSHSESPTTESPQRNAADRGSNTVAVESDVDEDLIITEEQPPQDM